MNSYKGSFAVVNLLLNQGLNRLTAKGSKAEHCFSIKILYNSLFISEI